MACTYQSRNHAERCYPLQLALSGRHCFGTLARQRMPQSSIARSQTTQTFAATTRCRLEPVCFAYRGVKLTTWFVRHSVHRLCVQQNVIEQCVHAVGDCSVLNEERCMKVWPAARHWRNESGQAADNSIGKHGNRCSASPQSLDGAFDQWHLANIAYITQVIQLSPHVTISAHIAT